MTVESGATVTAAGIGNDTRPFTLSGADQQVLNFGDIVNPSPANNADAIRSIGDALYVENLGLIEGGDRGIHQTAGSLAFTLVNQADGVIRAPRQAVRPDNDLLADGLNVINHGLIESADGRAVQGRGDGLTVYYYGTMIGGEEVIEGRLNAYVENHGLIRIRDGVADEDGVQFASGEMHNRGTIIASVDGVDIDEGLVHNHSAGVIISTGPDARRNAGGIAADKLLQDPRLDEADQPFAGLLRIINEGYIEGPRAVSTDLERTDGLEIVNSGTLVGRGGISIDLGPDVGNSSLTLLGASQITGDEIFGGGDDRVTLGALAAGTFLDGIVDGGAGDNTVDLAGYQLWQIRGFTVAANQVRLTLSLAQGLFQATFRNFDTWVVGDRSYSTAELQQVAPIPLPAALPLLLTALAGIGLAARRRRAA